METMSLKEVRKSKKLTLKNLSEISGISEANLCQIENGKQSANVLTRIRLENIFNCKIKFEDAADKKIRQLYPTLLRTK